jgi:hypothetical protein
MLHYLNIVGGFLKAVTLRLIAAETIGAKVAAGTP